MKRLSYFILLTLLMSLTSTPALAHDFEEGGIYYNILSGTTNVEVTFYGNNQFNVPDEFKYTGDVVIPSTVTHDATTYTVTSIGTNAFINSTDLESITLPNSVTSIDSYAFASCTSLESITLPSSVTSISFQAFAGCTGLTSITIPSNVTSIGSNAFYQNNLTSVYFLGATPPTIYYNYGSNILLTNQATVYVPLQYLDSYRGTGSNGTINEANLYPMLSPSTAYSTFSFDKAVNLSSIAGLNDSGNTLTAYIVSNVNTEGKTVTLVSVSEAVAVALVLLSCVAGGGLAIYGYRRQRTVGLLLAAATLTAYPMWEEPGIAVLWWTANKVLTAWLYLLVRRVLTAAQSTSPTPTLP